MIVSGDSWLKILSKKTLFLVSNVLRNLHVCFSERITEIIELEIQIEKCWRSRHDIGPELNVYLTHLTVDASLVLPECLIKWATSPLFFSSLVFTRSCNQNELCPRAVRLRLWNEIKQMRETTRISFFSVVVVEDFIDIRSVC